MKNKSREIIHKESPPPLPFPPPFSPSPLDWLGARTAAEPVSVSLAGHPAMFLPRSCPPEGLGRYRGRASTELPPTAGEPGPAGPL